MSKKRKGNSVLGRWRLTPLGKIVVALLPSNGTLPPLILSRFPLHAVRICCGVEQPGRLVGRRWCMNRQCGFDSPLLSDLHPLPIGKESGGSSAAIRFRMLQTIRASLSCDSGCLVDRGRVVGRVRCEARHISVNLIDEAKSSPRIVSMPVSQDLGENHARPIDTEMNFLPSMLAAAYMLDCFHRGGPLQHRARVWNWSSSRGLGDPPAVTRRGRLL